MGNSISLSSEALVLYTEIRSIVTKRGWKLKSKGTPEFSAETMAKTLKDNKILCPRQDVLVEIALAQKLDNYIARNPEGWAKRVLKFYKDPPKIRITKAIQRSLFE